MNRPVLIISRLIIPSSPARARVCPLPTRPVLIPVTPGSRFSFLTARRGLSVCLSPPPPTCLSGTREQISCLGQLPDRMCGEPNRVPFLAVSALLSVVFCPPLSAALLLSGLAALPGTYLSFLSAEHFFPPFASWFFLFPLAFPLFRHPVRCSPVYILTAVTTTKPTNYTTIPRHHLP